MFIEEGLKGSRTKHFRAREVPPLEGYFYFCQYYSIMYIKNWCNHINLTNLRIKKKQQKETSTTAADPQHLKFKE